MYFNTRTVFSGAPGILRLREAVHGALLDIIEKQNLFSESRSIDIGEKREGTHTKFALGCFHAIQQCFGLLGDVAHKHTLVEQFLDDTEATLGFFSHSI